MSPLDKEQAWRLLERFVVSQEKMVCLIKEQVENGRLGLALQAQMASSSKSLEEALKEAR